MLRKLVSGATALGIMALTTATAHAQGFRQFFSADFQNIGGGDLPTFIQTIINAVLVIAGVVAVVFLIVGGYRYITSSGNAEAAEAGRTTVLNAIIGLVIIFAAYLIVNFVIDRIIGFNATI